MTRNVHHTARAVKRDMNLALDHALPDKAEAALRVHLRGSPEDAALWDRMQAVDNLLRSESMAEAPPDFASRVMAAVAAQAEEEAVIVEDRAGLRAGLGLLLLAVIAVPLLATAIIGVQHWLSDPAAINNLLQQIVLLLNSMAQAVASIFQVIAGFLDGNAILPALLTTGIPLIMIWGWFMWYASQKRRQVVYHIPVRVIA